MAVGTIASLNVSKLTSTSFDVTFIKPANVTKIKWEIFPTNGSTAGRRTLTRACTGTTGDTKVESFSTLDPGQKYYLYATPYNVNEVGTKKTYSNSGATPINSIKMNTVTATSGSTVFDIFSQKNLPLADSLKVLNDSTANPGAGSPPGVSKPGTTDPVPNDLDSNSRVTLDIKKLETNHTYSIFVRSKATTTDGKTITSPWSLPIHVNTPPLSASGNNFASKNSNGDIQLDGGSLYAGTFPINAGSINVVTDTPNATGVVLNKTGIAGFNAGVKQFYISAATGDAYFAGTITAGAYISGTLASTVVANAATGAGLSGTVSTISTNYLRVVSDQIQNATGQISKVSTNGTTFYSGANDTAGARVLINQYGILGYSSSSINNLTGISFAINSTSSSIVTTDAAPVTIPAGSAYFSGILISASGSIGGWTIGADTLSATGLKITSATSAFGSTASIKYGAADQFATLFEPVTANFLIYNVYRSRNSIAIKDDTNIVTVGTIHSSETGGSKSVRNISASIYDPSGGNDGDMWAKYV